MVKKLVFGDSVIRRPPWAIAWGVVVFRPVGWKLG
jgi:hypothetical protein